MLTAIAAVAENGVIGRDGGLPWRLPEDMKWFKRTTMGHAVITGRRNFEASGEGVVGGGGVLPGRRNIVLTRQRDYRAEGAEVVHSLEEAMALVKGDEMPFVIGGEEIYRLALPRVERMYLTHVHGRPGGDTYFPEYDEGDWEREVLWEYAADERHEYGFSVVQYDRR